MNEEQKRYIIFEEGEEVEYDREEILSLILLAISLEISITYPKVKKVIKYTKRKFLENIIVEINNELKKLEIDKNDYIEMTDFILENPLNNEQQEPTLKRVLK